MLGLRPFLAATCLAVTFALPVKAETTVVVELYTSQGCSSCPAADRVLSDLSERPDVIALSLNVSYWDYLGWKDDLARPENTHRQRAYARRLRSRNVYTPQMMVDGRVDVIGNRRSQVEAVVNAYLQDEDDAKVSLTPTANGVRIEAAPMVRPPKEEMVVWIVGYDSATTKQIQRGENRGRAVTYTNAVREWREAARWDGRSQLSLEVSRPKGTRGCAAIVQEGGVGRIVGAAKLGYD